MRKPLHDRIKVMRESDWLDVQQIAYAYCMNNDEMDFDHAEALALLSVIETIESGSRAVH